MGNMKAYSGITTKIRAMQARLLTEEDFVNISNLNSVVDAVEYLKEKPAYEKYINQLEESLYHRRQIEMVLIQSFYDDYTRIFRFAGMEQKKFLKTYWKRYEIDLINYCLRIVFNHYDIPFDIDYKKKVFDRYSQLSISKLVTSKNIDELIDNLKGSEYYEPLHKLQESGQAGLVDYDLALDVYAFTTFWKKEKRQLKGSERELFVKDYGTKIDLLNIHWIYRAKKYYHMLAPDIYALTIPIHYRLRTEDFKALVDAPTVEEFLNRLEKTKYGDKVHLRDAEDIEKESKEILKKMYLSQRRRDPYSIATINTYLFLKEEEINRIVTALECIRYSLSPREILQYVGGVSE